VVIVGGSAPDLYAIGPGHGSMPLAPYVLKANGRFVAPRVPLDDGGTLINVIPIPLGGARTPAGAAVQVGVESSNASSVPATLVATPPSGMMPLTTQLQAFSAGGTGDWQWDFDGDGVFDATAPQGAKVAHTYAHPGEFTAMARRKVEGRWVYAVARISVAAEPQVLADAPADNPRAIALDIDYEVWDEAEQRKEMFHDGGYPPDDPDAYVRAVVLADGDSVRVLDAKLHDVRRISGLSHPSGVAVDALSRIYVADTGNNRVQRFNPDGSLDTTFANQGSLTGTATQHFSAPTTIALGYSGRPFPFTTAGYSSYEVLTVLDSGHDQLVFCTGIPLKCTAESPRIVHDSPFGTWLAGPRSLTALTVNVSRNRDCDLKPVVAAGREVLVAEQGGTSPRFRAEGLSSRSIQALASTFDVGIFYQYAAGVDTDGAIYEWLLTAGTKTRERRKTELEFPVRALAFDPWGWWVTFLRAEKAKGDGIYGETGALVFYVAGPGHVQRRALGSIKQPLLW
jgi:hypothetical protein